MKVPLYWTVILLVPLVTGDYHQCRQDSIDKAAEIKELKIQLGETRTVLSNVTEGFLTTICDEVCIQLIVYSNGNAAIRQPIRFGVFNYTGVNPDQGSNGNEGAKYPSYQGIANKQNLFYMHEFGEWEYWHQYERWIIGPIHNKALGGVMIRPFDPSKRCPYNIKWYRSNSYYYDRNHPNIWNPQGNPWVEDNTIRVDCYDEEEWPKFECRCEVLNISSTYRTAEYHKWTLGNYRRVDPESRQALGYLAPIYQKMDEEDNFIFGEGQSFLYSHHPRGRVWTVGSSMSTWAIRLNLLPQGDEVLASKSCPLDPPFPTDPELRPWEFLQSTKGPKNQDEMWQDDETVKVACIDHLFEL